MTENKRAVQIISGGLDSTTLLYYLLDKKYDVTALSFNYGQKHIKELLQAKKITSDLDITHYIIDMSDIKELLSKSALTGDIVVPEVPEIAEHYETLKQTVVPNRNAIMLSIAYANAINIGADIVAYGAHFSDRDVYPDCRIEFVKMLNDAFNEGNWSKRSDNTKPEIIAPFINMQKSEIVRIGNKLKVPFQETWSCYKGEDVQCGVCSSCRERKRAFKEAEVIDPTIYKE